MKDSPLALPTTDEELKSLIAETINCQIVLEQTRASRDSALLKAGEPFAEVITTTEAQIQERLECLHRWAAANKDRFGTAKSISVNGHRLGWRMGNPATKLVRATWDKVMQRLKDIVTAGQTARPSALTLARAEIARRFIRVIEEPAKDAMINARDDEASAELLKEVGVGFKQDSTFFLTPDREGQDEKTLNLKA